MKPLSRTEYILKEVKSQFKKTCVLWSGGKDSTVLLYIISKLFKGFPFDVVHLDNGMEFEENYSYMDMIKKSLGFELIKENVIIKKTDSNGLNCCGHNKTQALKKVINRGYDSVIVSIRQDEHSIRAMERYFSPRDKEFRWKVFDAKKGSLQEPEFINWGIVVSDFGKECDHVRVHPILHWTENNVWNYIKEWNVPVNPLYFSKNGKRFRSIGCKKCSKPINSKAVTIDQIIEDNLKGRERDNRGQEKELAMQKLRALGYM